MIIIKNIIKKKVGDNMADIELVNQAIQQSTIEYSDPIVGFEDKYTCNNNEQYNISTQYEDKAETIIKGYNTTLYYPLCTIIGSYLQDEGDELKCYQFFLYNDRRNLIGGTQKIYGNDSPIFNCENLNNKSVYYLKLKCISQSGKEAESKELKIQTNYLQSKVFGTLDIALDKTTAENVILATLIDTTGVSYDANGVRDTELTFADGKVEINNGKYVVFTDEYHLMTNYFVCRLWLKDIVQKADNSEVNILTLSNADNTENIIITFKDDRFHAYKHSCGLVSHYISDKIIDYTTDEEIPITYLAVGYYNGRIHIYAEIVSEDWIF